MASPHKVVLIGDPGIDGAFAVALALFDPDIEVLGLAASAGNVRAAQATRNMHVLIEHLDPPRWPRLGEAPEVSYESDGTKIHGAHGLGAKDFPCATLHHLLPSEKLVVECVRQFPEEVTVVCLGPCTVLARALDHFPGLAQMAKRLVLLGGTHQEPGNAGPVSEFHFFCDPAAARQVLRSGAPITLIPLDVMRRVLFSPADLLGLPEDQPGPCRFLRQIVPFGISATANLYGIEGFHLKDVLGIAAVALPEAVTTRSMAVDVETRGELTRGMTVFDRRGWLKQEDNVDVAVEVDGKMIRSYIRRVLGLE